MRAADIRAVIRVLVAFAALLFVSVAVRMMWPVPIVSQLVAYVGTDLLLLAAAFVCAVVALRRAGVERRMWAYISITAGFVALGDSFFVWYVTSVDARGPALPAAFQVTHVVAALSVLALAVIITEIAEENLLLRLRLYSEVAALSVVAVPVVYTLWTRSLFAPIPGANDVVPVIAALYPVYGVLMCCISVAFVSGARTSNLRSWHVLFAGAFMMYGLGMIGWPHWYASLLAADGPESFQGTFNAAASLAAFVLLGAAWIRLRDPLTESSMPKLVFPAARRAGWRWAGIAIPTLSVAALPLLMFSSAVQGGTAVSHTLFVWSAVSLAGLVAFRSVIVAVDRARLGVHAVLDPVTGARNHRCLREDLADRVRIATAEDSPFSILLVDADGFDRVNDIHGHVAGDGALRDIAAVTQDCVAQRPDVRGEVYRSGADEFAVLLDLAGDEAATLAECIRSAVTRSVRVNEFPVSISVGVATLGEDAEDADGLLECALSAQACARLEMPGSVTRYNEEQATSLDPGRRVAHARRSTQHMAVRALAEVVDSRDGGTSHHSRGVADLVVEISSVLGLSAERSRMLELAAQMHDVGKVAIPCRLLTKPGALTESERAIFAEHPVVGERILRSTGLSEAARWIRWHHERWDGEGYPDGISGYDIPFESRVLSICDAFEAMTSDRPYRSAMSVEAALQEIDLQLGAQFDPELSDVFIKMISEKFGGRAAQVRPRAG